ncbi:MAG TPA: hypothetical protein VK681_22010 [Reyranella sp.]|jgi:hypothetical protein|nr:hypothetical protein [Reyranella sp.]
MHLIDCFDCRADLFPDRHCLHDGTPGGAVPADELVAFAKHKLSGVNAPKSVDFIAALARSRVGKELNKTPREPYWPAANARSRDDRDA